MRTRIIIYADENMILTNGEVYGKQIFLAEGMSAEDFHEITEEEYAESLSHNAGELLSDMQLDKCAF